MTNHEAKDAIGRGEQVQHMERIGTGILGAGIIIMMVSVPLLTAILLIYLWVR